MKYQLISQNQQLAELCQSLAASEALALDSEFMRIRTYYPQVGLLQLHNGKETCLIDPLEIDEWQGFTALLRDPKLKKYFHACSEDIDVFMTEFELQPSPLYDSQIFAAFLDNPISSGYAGLVAKYLGVALDKSETRTDWLARPLSENQCRYAADDVVYLLPLMNTLIDAVTQKGWFDAAFEECQNLLAKKREIIAPQDAYLTLKNSWQLKGNALNYLQRMASWRLSYAREHNIAVNFVVHEEVLWKLARYQPTSLAELDALGLKGRSLRLFGTTLLSFLKAPVTTPLPPISRVTHYPNYKTLATQLKDVASQIAQETQLSPELLLARRHINSYVSWLNAGCSETELPELVSGWRAPLFAPYLAQLG